MIEKNKKKKKENTPEKFLLRKTYHHKMRIK
jgi:hypothetical protein